MKNTYEKFMDKEALSVKATQEFYKFFKEFIVEYFPFESEKK